MSRNPYQPPQTAVADAAPPVAVARSFPFDLVLRFVLGLLLTAIGAWALVQLRGQWDTYTDRAIIAQSWNPWWYAVPEIGITGTGLALLLRSRLVFVPFLLHAVVDDLHTLVLANWHVYPFMGLWIGLQLALLSFLVRLLTRGLLR